MKGFYMFMFLLMVRILFVVLILGLLYRGFQYVSHKGLKNTIHIIWEGSDSQKDSLNFLQKDSLEKRK